jgi:outer membrane protein assembly factor BamB
VLAATLAVGVSGCAGHSQSGQAAGSGETAGANAVARIAAIPGGDWRQFDYTASRSGVDPSGTGITAGDVHALRRRTVHLPGTVDSAPVELHAIRVDGHVRDVVIVTTSYGITLAMDPSTGHWLWKYVPRGTAGLEGSPQITTATPIVDPNRRFVYAASPNGYIHKLRISNGRQVWGRKITADPGREKIEGALNILGGSVMAATGGYTGDAPSYQGHLVLISRRTGHITRVWNSLCSNRRRLINPPSSCPASDSAIWGRAGTVIQPRTGRVLIATGNGRFNGSTDWGDSVLELSPSLRLLRNWTPRNQAQMNATDDDLGSTEPALLPAVGGQHLAVQGGKDGVLRLLDLARLGGTSGGPSARTGGQLQNIAAPGQSGVFTQPVVWTHGAHTYVIVANGAGTNGYVLGKNRRLYVAWRSGDTGTSPVIAGGLLYQFDPGGRMLILDPVNGRTLASLPASPGHWNSPIVVGGRIILPVGNDNDHRTSGVLYVYHLPGR